MQSVVVLGKGELAIKICEWFLKSGKYKLVSIVPTIPEPTWTASLKEWAISESIPVVASGHFKDLDIKSDLAFSVYYDKIVNKDFIDKCGRVLNLHNSPLPAYRGVSPINWVLKHGKLEHGVTIHEVTPGIDDGPIVSQVKFSIYPDIEEVIDVYRKALKFAYLLFEQTIPVLDNIIAQPQDETQATYYSRHDDKLLQNRRSFTRGNQS